MRSRSIERHRQRRSDWHATEEAHLGTEASCPPGVHPVRDDVVIADALAHVQMRASSCKKKKSTDRETSTTPERSACNSNAYPGNTSHTVIAFTLRMVICIALKCSHVQFCNPARAELDVGPSRDTNNVGPNSMQQQRHTWGGKASCAHNVHLWHGLVVFDVFIHVQICNSASAELYVDRSRDIDSIEAIGVRQQRHS